MIRITDPVPSTGTLPFPGVLEQAFQAFNVSIELSQDEQTLQTAFDTAIDAMSRHCGKAFTCCPLLGAEKIQTIDNQSPDIVLYGNCGQPMVDKKSEINIVTLGELNRSYPIRAIDEGQILSAAQSLLKNHQTFRTYIYCFLTNGRGFHLFKLVKSVSTLFLYLS